MCAFHHPVITTLNSMCRSDLYRPECLAFNVYKSHGDSVNSDSESVDLDSESVDLECSLRFYLSQKCPGEDVAAGLEIQPSGARLEIILWVYPCFSEVCQQPWPSSFSSVHQDCEFFPRNLVSCAVCSNNQIPWLTDSWNGMRF